MTPVDRIHRFDAHWSRFFTEFDWLFVLTSCLDAYISRYGDFCAHNNDTTDYFTPLRMRARGNYALWEPLPVEPLPVYTVTALIADQQGTEWQPQLHTIIPLGRTQRSLVPRPLPLPGNPRPQMSTFSQTTLTIRMDRRTDGQKSPNDCSNPPPTLCGEG